MFVLLTFEYISSLQYYLLLIYEAKYINFTSIRISSMVSIIYYLYKYIQITLMRVIKCDFQI